MKSSPFFLAILFSALFFVSCEKDDLPQSNASGNYANGFFVVNEGSATDGTVSFVKSDFSSVTPNVFAVENPSEIGLGKYVQSIFFHENKAFIISGSNVITVVDRNTFKLIGRIAGGLANPRYGVVVNGKAYITNSNTFSFDNPTSGNTDDYLAVVNLETLQVESTITMNALADKTLLINGKLYVSGGSYGEGNQLNVVDPTTNSVTKTFTVDYAPNSMEAYNGHLYVLCSNGVHSNIVDIDLATDTVANTVNLPDTLISSFNTPQNLNVENDQFYFTVEKKVFSSPLSATTVSDVPLFESEAQSLYGFTVENNVIYIADATNFNSNGRILVYSTSGTLHQIIEVGVGPNGVYFN